MILKHRVCILFLKAYLFLWLEVFIVKVRDNKSHQLFFITYDGNQLMISLFHEPTDARYLGVINCFKLSEFTPTLNYIFWG